jgi:hypothetical protein
MLTQNKIPLAVKLVFTAFMAVLIPFYLKEYGATNFLYFCDVGLFFTLAAVWTEKPILAAMPAVGILLPQALWCADFIGTAMNLPVNGMTAYMFDSNIPAFARSLSFFHFWLPFLLVYLVYRLGYDPRALKYWTLLAWALLIVCFLFMPAPPAPNSATPVNINYVFGMNDKTAQTYMHPLAWLAMLMVVLPAFLYLPTHWALLRLFPVQRQVARVRQTAETTLAL